MRPVPMLPSEPDHRRVPPAQVLAVFAGNGLEFYDS